jgi:hypothetical protein
MRGIDILAQARSFTFAIVLSSLYNLPFVKLEEEEQKRTSNILTCLPSNPLNTSNMAVSPFAAYRDEPGR